MPIKVNSWMWANPIPHDGTRGITTVLSHVTHIENAVEKICANFYLTVKIQTRSMHHKTLALIQPKSNQEMENNSINPYHT